MQNGITRRNFNKTCAAGILALTAGGRLAAAQPTKQPNVLLITTDQQRVDAMSAVGNQWAKTPHMDSIAANGVYFRKSYCPYPLCSPSRSSLHTGRPPHEIGVDRNTVPINPAITISGQVFKAAGYDTGYSGKWHMPETYPADGIAGFEVLNKTSRNNKMAKDVDEATMNQAIEFLKRKRDKPFYLVVSFINPHDICLLASETSPLLDDLLKRYMPAEGAQTPPMPDNFAMPAAAPESVAKRSSAHAQWDENHWRRYRYGYFRMMEDVDRQVGQVLETLRSAGQEDNTLIVFTSDHGEGLACHHWTGKMMYFDDEAAVPLIVSWKGVTPAGRIDKDHLVTALDVLPTICDYAGLTPPEKMRGESLRAVIEHPETPGHEFVASEMPGTGGKRSFMVRTKQYKYMFFPDTPPSEMLLDLDADPLEMKNLAGQEAQVGQQAVAGELERHRKLLAQWKELTEEAQHPIDTTSQKRKKPKAAKAAVAKGGAEKKAPAKKPAAAGQAQGQGKDE